MTLAKAQELDTKYPGNASKFAIPTFKSLGLPAPSDGSGVDQNCIYFCGNSLGLMPKATSSAVSAELQTWGDRGVVGHFRRDDYDGKEPWVSIDEPLGPLLAEVLGAHSESEVSVMNTLTGNLHTLMSAFYKPEASRYKILFEDKAFPSDAYAFQGQAKLHGYDPKDALIPLKPRSGEYTLRTEDILSAIKEHGSSIALVIFSGIQYYTGQYFEIEKITKAGKSVGAVVGWDLAHAAGNVDVRLHDWDVDFAVFCSYKYLNSGPGSIGGIFVHEKHAEDGRPRLAGWWGNNEATRFQMLEQFDPIPGARGFRMSNPSVLNVVCVYESLKLYREAGGISKLRERSVSLTGFLYELLTSSKYFVKVSEFSETSKSPSFTIITPENPDHRGAQLSLLFSDGIMQTVFDELEKRGIIGDERRPSVIRLAPNHFYNTHVEVFQVAKALDEIFSQLK